MPIMELLQQFTTFPFIFTFIFFLLMLVRQNKKSKNTDSSSQLPPGPYFKLPLIGHLLYLLGEHPHRKLKDLAKIHGPIMYLKLGEVSNVVISSPSVAKQMMTTHDLNFVDRPFILVTHIITYGSKDVLMAPYGEYWRQVRRICVTELLSAKRVQSFWSVREEEVSNLIGRITLVAGSQINISEQIFTLINDITARAAFGKTCKDKEAFISEIKEFVRLASGFNVVDLFPSMKFLEVISGIKSKIEIVHKKVDKILEDIVREHKEKCKETENTEGKVEDDLVDVLLRVQESGELEFPFTMDNLKAVTFDMFMAGTDTSSTVIEWTFTELLRNPRVMEKAQAEVRRILNGKKKINQEDIDKMNYLRLQGFEIIESLEQREINLKAGSPFGKDVRKLVFRGDILILNSIRDDKPPNGMIIFSH
ncbi:Cytochrome p450 [Thalictrum thalictroides]|uniref:Cytochrome p450 n=1 Tax=Thalictrum thalictroides TaxID=46969 RepID=A0A7J6UT62_THATH|nr:Cytochrome p450 [Thalictrum thalictroides]